MVKILVSTHGDLGKEMCSTLNMIVGKTDHVVYLGLQTEDNFDYFQKRMEEIINEKGIQIILTDIPNASPFNSAMISMKNVIKPIYVITGVNMPLLIELSMQSNELNEIEKILEVSRESIRCYSGMESYI